PIFLRPAPRGSEEHLTRIGVASGASAALVFLATALLAAPNLPDGRYFGHWVPDLPHFARYDGRLESATLDGSPLPYGPLPDPAGVRARLRGPFLLSLHLRPGSPPPALAALFLVSDIDSREVLLVGVDGNDAVGHARDLAGGLGLGALAVHAGGGAGA